MNSKYNIHSFILIIVILSIVLPIIFIAMLSVAKNWTWPNLLPHFFSTRGLYEIFGGYYNIPKILFTSIGLSFSVAIVSTLVGFMTSWAIVFYDFYGKRLFQSGVFLPIIFPANIFAMGIHVTFIKLNLSDKLIGVFICHLIYTLPYTVGILKEVIELTGAKYLEQAKVLGCSNIKIIYYIIIPLILPAVLSAISMAYIISFSQYFLTMLIGGGNVKTFAVVMFPFISAGDRTISSAYVLMFLISSLCVFAVFEFLVRKKIVEG